MSYQRAIRRGLGPAATLVAALAVTSVGRAASPADRAAAKQHLSQAEALKDKGRLAEACQHLEEVERLDPKLPTLIELAECSEQVGHFVEARAQWTAARDRAKHDEKPQSRARAESRISAVEKRVAHLTLQLAPNSPAGTQVLRDDVALDAASLGSALPTNPGDHTIVVKLAGHDDAKYPVKLADGANQTLAIAAGPASGAESAAAPPPSSPSPAAAPILTAAPTLSAAPTPSDSPAPTGWWSSQRTTGVILGAAGLVAVGGGSVLCVLASKDSGSLGSKFDTRLALGGVSLAAGSVLLVSGLVALATAPKDEAAQHARVKVLPTLFVAQSGTVLGATGEF